VDAASAALITSSWDSDETSQASIGVEHDARMYQAMVLAMALGARDGSAGFNFCGRGIKVYICMHGYGLGWEITR
jgi:hypothetical protein